MADKNEVDVGRQVANEANPPSLISMRKEEGLRDRGLSGERLSPQHASLSQGTRSFNRLLLRLFKRRTSMRMWLLSTRAFILSLSIAASGVIFVGGADGAEAQNYKGSLKYKEHIGGARPSAKKNYSVSFRKKGSKTQARIGNAPWFNYERGSSDPTLNYFYGESNQYAYSRGCKAIIGLQGDGIGPKSISVCLFLSVDCDDYDKGFLHKYCGTLKR